MAPLSGDRGDATTQLVLLTPVLLVVLMAIVQLGLWLHAANLATATADRAVAAAAPLGSTAAAGVDAGVAFAAEAGAALDGPPVVDRTGTTVRVTVRVRLPRLVPGVPRTVTRQVAAPVERFVAEVDR